MSKKKHTLDQAMMAAKEIREDMACLTSLLTAADARIHRRTSMLDAFFSERSPEYRERAKELDDTHTAGFNLARGIERLTRQLAYEEAE